MSEGVLTPGGGALLTSTPSGAASHRRWRRDQGQRRKSHIEKKYVMTLGKIFLKEENDDIAEKDKFTKICLSEKCIENKH